MNAGSRKILRNGPMRPTHGESGYSVQQHAATFFEQAEAASGADLPQFVRDEFDAFLECGRPGPRLPAPALR